MVGVILKREPTRHNVFLKRETTRHKVWMEMIGYNFGRVWYCFIISVWLVRCVRWTIQNQDCSNLSVWLVRFGLMNGIKPSMAHTKYQFGQYFQTHEESNNRMSEHTLDAIFAGPIANNKGSFYVINLKTDQQIKPNWATVLPVTDTVIKQQKQLNTCSSIESKLVGADEPLPMILSSRLFAIAQLINIDDNILYQSRQHQCNPHGNQWKASCTKRTKHIDIRYFYITNKVK